MSANYLEKVNEFIKETQYLCKLLGRKTIVKQDKEGIIFRVEMSRAGNIKFGFKTMPYFFPLYAVDPEFYTEHTNSNQEGLSGTCFDYVKRDIIKCIEQF